MRFPQVGRHRVGHRVGIVKVGDRRREMRLAGQQDILGTTGQVRLILIS
jgi:hypothetical protein